MAKTFIFGHQKPDTDTVCASICLSYLKNKLGYNTEPRVLGDINKETKFALRYFDVSEPELLQDVSAQIANLPYNKEAKIKYNASIYEAFKLMEKLQVTGLPIIKEKDVLCGYVNLKQISRALIQNDATHLHTSMTNLVDTLNGKIVYKFNEEIEGTIRVIYDERDYFNVKEKFSENDILIISNGSFYINHVPEFKAKLIILVNNAFATSDFLEFAKNNRISIIVSKLNLYDAIQRIETSNYVNDISITSEPKVIHLYDYRHEFIEMANNYGHTNYPVVNNKNQCLGMIKLLDAHKYEKQPVILVDHNQKSQSVSGLEEANILEVVDHHNLSTIDTTAPISFRSMPVGSTCTIIYQMFLESGVRIPKNIAGLMMAAVLSDTLILKSPTTTKFDVEAVNALAEICEEDYEVFGVKMFRAGSSIKGMSPVTILNQDFKSYNYEDQTIGISQVITMDIEEIFKNKDIYIHLLNEMCEKQGYKVFMMAVTDSIKNGSYLFFNETGKYIVADSFNLDEIEQGEFIKDIVSRKKQLAPALLECLERRK